MTQTLHIDIETYSEVSIADCGNYKYAMDPSFTILLIAYGWDEDECEPTKIIDLTAEPMPDWFIKALLSPQVTKVAHNAVFERVCLTMALRKSGQLREDEWLDPAQWRCTMVQAVRCGLPASLAQVGAVLDLEDQKMSEGKALIKLFCTPHEPKSNGLFANSKRAMPEDFPEQWETFKAYCVRDVDVERQIDAELAWMDVPGFERELYAIDQHINDRGVLIDLKMAKNAVKMDAIIKARLNKEAIALTGLSNPNSVSQLKAWVNEQLGSEMETLRKSDIADLKGKTGNERVERVLQIRAEMGKTSCAKYGAMLDVAGPDGRARGLTQFYGSRTGRWAGRLIQMQNLPQNHLAELDYARTLLREGDMDLMELAFGNVPDTMSQLIRTAFIASEGKTFAVCDFSAIEARVLAWLAGEEWVLDVFRKGRDIYCETASQMFGVPVAKHGPNAELRQKGKISVLALGYGGSVGALDAMGGQRMGLTQDDEQELVNKWRAANPNIVGFWKEVELAAKRTFTYGLPSKVGNLVFEMFGDTMTIQLPSGRRIAYPKMCTATNRFGKPSVKFMGMDQTTKKWCWIETHGGKLVENITQAVARDCLAETMAKVEAAGFPVVFHVHDELICEVPENSGALAKIQDIFKITPTWATTLPLKGAGYETRYYLKD